MTAARRWALSPNPEHSAPTRRTMTPATIRVVNDGCPAVTGARKDIGNEGDGVNISAGASNNTFGGGRPAKAT